SEQPCWLFFELINHQDHSGKELNILARQKEELSEFAHEMAHDLRNYLQAIMTYTNLLDSDYDKTYIAKIRKQIENISRFMGRSLALADAGLILEKSEYVNMTKVIQKVAEVTIPSSVALNLINSENNIPQIEGDSEKIFQIYKNLFENAVKHAQPSYIKVKYIKSSNFIKILVSNDGSPIPQEIRKQLSSTRFRKSKNKGLGLSIIRKLVEAHGWSIRLTEDDITTFRINIPINK
ncbi:MAG: sensor histidine kinase, partial [Candidatus Hodarchaeales archaeon]